MQSHKDDLRLRSLYKERLLEIKRQGIIVELYHRHQILPAYLQCALADMPKLQAILNSKISLQLCDLNGLPLIKIGKKAYFVRREDLYDECRVYLNNKLNFRGMQEGPFYILVKNNATIGVLSEILNKRLEGDRYFHKIEDFIGDDQVTSIPLEENLKIEFQSQSNLNEEQNKAISKVFSNHLTFIKGPPGCGKTKTVSRMVKMLAERGMKVLVGSVSNLANQTLINEIVIEMTEHNYLCDTYPEIGMKKVHLLINYSRKALQKVSEQAKFYSINNQLYHYILSENTSEHYHKGNIMEEIEKLQEGEKVSNIFWAIYMKSYKKLIADVNVVISTTINSSKLSKYTAFRPDVGIIDEAAQASWADTYGFLAFEVTRMVFVGDEKQLRPTVIGDSTSNQILKETMFEKLSQKNPDYFVHLKRQYRMHPEIAQFPNQQIYNNLLVNDPSVSQRQCSLEYFRLYTTSFVTHNFVQIVQELPDSVDSQKGVKQFYNQYEGSLIMDFLFSVPFEQWKNIGILTFYDMQSQVMIQSLETSVENFNQYGLTIKTIDGYQGGQKDYILISTVRSNPDKNPGFCSQLNRVNVALTRAKKGLIVFGDPQTLSQGKSFDDPSLNIWGSFHNFMSKKQRILPYEMWHLLISRIKNKEAIYGKLYEIYMSSLNLMQKWETFYFQNQNQLLTKNPQLHAVVRNSLKNNLATRSNSNENKLNDVIQLLFKAKNGQNQIQVFETGKSFQEEVNFLLTSAFTHKQISFASEFIHKVSAQIYSIISVHHELKDFEKLSEDLKIKINDEKCKIQENLKKLLQKNFTQIDTEVQKNLLSLSLMHRLVSLYKEAIDPEISQLEPSQENKN